MEIECQGGGGAAIAQIRKAHPEKVNLNTDLKEMR